MRTEYAISFYVWPYHSVKRGDACKVAVELEPERGSKNPTVNIDAESFDDAYSQARIMLRGIKLDERVWQAGIEEIRKVKS